MRGRVSGGEGNRNNEISGGKAKKTQHEQLASPAWQKMFEHGDGAFAVRAGRSHTAVDRKRAQQSEQYQHTRRQRRKHASRQKCDAWLVSERGKIIDASQTHDLPPRVRVMLVFPGVRTGGAFVIVLQEPALQAGI